MGIYLLPIYEQTGALHDLFLGRFILIYTVYQILQVYYENLQVIL